MKKQFIAAVLAGAVLLSGCSGVSQESYNSVVAENESLKTKVTEMQATNNSLTTNNNELANKRDELANECDELTSKYEALEKEARPYLELSEAERAAEMERLQKEEDERKAKEEAERQEEEAKGYETGITFDDISRSPDKYKGKKVKFTGRVLQLVFEGTNISELRMSTNGNYDDVILISYDPSKLDGRILEDDNITVCGTFSKMYTYTTVLGSSQTVPLVYVDIITINH